MLIVNSFNWQVVDRRVTVVRGSALVNLQELVRCSEMRSCSSLNKLLVCSCVLLTVSIFIKLLEHVNELTLLALFLSSSVLTSSSSLYSSIASFSSFVNNALS
jgi:hypothetical protein